MVDSIFLIEDRSPKITTLKDKIAKPSAGAKSWLVERVVPSVYFVIGRWRRDGKGVGGFGGSFSGGGSDHSICLYFGTFFKLFFLLSYHLS